MTFIHKTAPTALIIIPIHLTSLFTATRESTEYECNYKWWRKKSRPRLSNWSANFVFGGGSVWPSNCPTDLSWRPCAFKLDNLSQDVWRTCTLIWLFLKLRRTLSFSLLCVNNFKFILCGFKSTKILVFFSVCLSAFSLLNVRQTRR